MKIDTYEDMTQIELSNRMFGMTLKASLYFVDGLLIDTGTIRKKKQLVNILNDLPIEKVLLTHHHEDHSGLAHWLSREKNLPIYCHQLGVEKGAKNMRLPLYRRVFWGPKKSYQAIAIQDEFLTDNYLWRTIHTPGHAKDHIALYNEEKGWLFGGDLYVQRQPKSLFSFESLPQLIKSLEKILTYDFTTYICSHAGVLPKGRQAIEGKLNYLCSVRDQVYDLHERGMTTLEIRKKLFPKRHMIHYLSFFDNSPTHLIRSVIKDKELT